MYLCLIAFVASLAIHIGRYYVNKYLKYKYGAKVLSGTNRFESNRLRVFFDIFWVLFCLVIFMSAPYHIKEGDGGKVTSKYVVIGMLLWFAITAVPIAISIGKARNFFCNTETAFEYNLFVAEPNRKVTIKKCDIEMIEVLKSKIVIYDRFKKKYAIKFSQLEILNGYKILLNILKHDTW